MRPSRRLPSLCADEQVPGSRFPPEAPCRLVAWDGNRGVDLTGIPGRLFPRASTMPPTIAQLARKHGLDVERLIQAVRKHDSRCKDHTFIPKGATVRQVLPEFGVTVG